MGAKPTLTKAQSGSNAPTLAAVRPGAWQAPSKGLPYEQCETKEVVVKEFASRRLPLACIVEPPD
jgi:hypothetical protein